MINVTYGVKTPQKEYVFKQKRHKMCKNDLKLTILPDVLQEIVLIYAYNMPKTQIMQSLRTLQRINEMKLPFFLLKERIWSWDLKMFLANPCKVYFPIEYYGSYSRIFDDDSIFCFLLALDFRRRNVRLFGSRENWMSRICTSWRAIEALGAYFKMLLRSKHRVMKKRSPLIQKMV